MKLLNYSLLAIALQMATSCNCSSKEQCDVTAKDSRMDAIEAIMTRTSVREYLPDRAIPADTVEILLRAGMAAPTARNSQPWEFVVVDTREGLDSLKSASPHNRMLETASLSIVACGNMERTMPDEGRLMWVEDLSAATENILLAAHAMGLGAVWVGVYPIQERVEAVSRALQLPDGIIPMSIIPVGYPAGDNTPKDKWVPERVHYNQY